MRGRIYGLFLLLGTLTVVFAQGAAARIVGTSATTGLLTLTPGHVAILTLADVGTVRDAEVVARLEILDGRNRILATTRGVLRPGQPLSLEVKNDGTTGRRQRVRARVRVLDGGRDSTTPKPSKPVLSFEILGSGTGDVHVGLTCPFPGGGGFEFNCTCVFDDLAVPDSRP
ncbi:MAG: hypothetical protein ACRD21_18170 [Vicinamibacteria bacterium]